MQIEGTIKVIQPEQQVSASFKKRELVVVTDEQYPQSILVEFTQDKCDLLNLYMEGEKVKVSINLRGREWVNPQGETKYFNSIQAWRIEREDQTQAPPQNQSAVDQYQTKNSTAFQPASNFIEEEHDDLPF